LESKDLDPYGGGASSIEQRASEPVCSFDPETGFAINASTVDDLCWYTLLSRAEGEEETLLQSRNDD
jgi:hypothetical protein